MRRFLLPAVVGVLALVLGVLLGQMNAKTETVERTAEVEKRVEVTPQVCIEALDLAGEAIDYGAQASEANSEILDAIVVQDVAGIEAGTAKLEALTEKVRALTPQIGPVMAACRAAA